MSSSLVTVTPDARVDECCKKMEDNQVRRLPVVDDQGKCCGIVSQADIALHADKAETGNLVRSEEHTSELQSLMRISYAVFCLKKKKTTRNTQLKQQQQSSTPQE